MAEAILNKIGKAKFRAYKHGEPPERKSKSAYDQITCRARLRYFHFRSKSWDEFATRDAPQFDFIFTVCDDAAGGGVSSGPVSRPPRIGGIPDPAAVLGCFARLGPAFQDAYGLLCKRIELFAEHSVSLAR